MKMLADESVLSEFTMYFLCPGSEGEGWVEDRIVRRIGLFDRKQRKVIAGYLHEIAQCLRSSIGDLTLSSG